MLSAENSTASTLAHEDEPFLTPKEHSTVSLEHQLRKPIPLRCKRSLTFSVHGIIIILYTIIFLFSLHSQRCAGLPPSSSIEGLNWRYTSILFRNLTGNPYAGPSSDQIDSTWATLLAQMHLRVTSKELEHDNQVSVALPEGGGYLGWMGVFHELHCVEMLRKWNYRDHYHPNLTSQEEEHTISHVDHCVDLLRQTALCHADASITTFVWHPAKQRPMFNASESTHNCIDWSKLMASIADRVVSEEEILRLENPLM